MRDEDYRQQVSGVLHVSEMPCVTCQDEPPALKKLCPICGGTGKLRGRYTFRQQFVHLGMRDVDE